MTAAGGPARKSPRSPQAPAAPPPIQLHAPPGGGDPRWAMPAAWLVIAAVGAVLLWIAIARHPVGDYLTESDFYGGYAEGAALIRHGRLDVSRYIVVGPVYDAAVALVGLAVPDLFTAAKLLSVAAACGAILLWLALLARLAGATTGFWTVVLLAVNTHFTRYGYSATTDMLAACLEAACLFALLGARGRYAPLASGALAALAALTRYSALALLPAGLLCVAWGWVQEGASRKRVALLFAAGFAIVAAPWLAYSLAHGQVPGSMLARNFVYYATPDAWRNTQDWPGDFSGAAPPTTSFGELVRRDAGSLALGWLRAIPEHLARDAGELLGWPLAALSILGLALLLLERRPRGLAALAIPGAALFLALVPIFYSARYSLPVAPFYLSLAGAAIASPRYALLAGRAGVPLKPLVALLPIALALGRNASDQARAATQVPIEVIEAGRALKQAAAPGDRVVSRKGHIGYYSGLAVTSFPRLATLGELADHCRRQDARFLYYSWLEVQIRPDFSYLLDTTSAVPGLSAVHVTDEHASVVYRIGADFGRDPAWFGDPIASRVHWVRVVALANPDSVGVRDRNLLAAYALDEGRWAEALAQAGRATRAEPRDTMGWALAGEALRELGRLAEAEGAYSQALALDPGQPRYRIGLGWVQLRLGREAEAAATWRPAIGVAGDDSTRRAMADLYDRLGDREAAAAARAAVRR